MIERSALSSLLPAVAVLATCAWACETADVPVFSVPRAAAADAGLAEASPSKAPVSAGTQQDFCAGSGPPVLVDSATDGGPVATCPDLLAQQKFRYALCTCDACGSDHAIVTDAFDSSRGPYVASTATPGGSIGVNGDLHPGPMHIGGSLWASTASTITTSSLYVAGDLHTEGELRPAADPSVMADALSVQGDAWMAGGLQTTGGVTVKGTLHVPNGQPTDVTGPSFVHGATDGSGFTVPTACDCAPEHLVDVAGVVASYEASNDDDAGVGISPSALGNVQTAVTQTLACGRIFLTRIGPSPAPIQLTTQGRVALFVNGDISTNGDFIVEVPPGSELDLFVAGNVTVGGAFRVGDAANPARARMYVGGTSVNLQGAATLAANLYAPHAALTLGASAATTVYGAIFALRFQGTANLTIHYDEAILTPSSTPACSAPASCTSSCDCAGQACNGGTCGACSDTTAPCCPPLVCGPSKTCVADVIAR